jgi:hypothetical protein
VLAGVLVGLPWPGTATAQAAAAADYRAQVSDGCYQAHPDVRQIFILFSRTSTTPGVITSASLTPALLEPEMTSVGAPFAIDKTAFAHMFVRESQASRVTARFWVHWDLPDGPKDIVMSESADVYANFRITASGGYSDGFGLYPGQLWPITLSPEHSMDVVVTGGAPGRLPGPWRPDPGNDPPRASRRPHRPARPGAGHRAAVNRAAVNRAAVNRLAHRCWGRQILGRPDRPPRRARRRVRSPGPRSRAPVRRAAPSRFAAPGSGR